MGWSPRSAALVGGLLAVVGVITWVTSLLYAMMYVPLCQPGAQWSQEPACQRLLYPVWAGILLASAGFAIAAVGVFLRFTADRRRRRR